MPKRYLIHTVCRTALPLLRFRDAVEDAIVVIPDDGWLCRNCPRGLTGLGAPNVRLRRYVRVQA
jgi:hypothetical protein